MKKAIYKVIQIIFILLIQSTLGYIWAEKQEEPVLELTIEEAIEKAVLNNAQIEEARLQWIISDLNVKAEWGQFEPLITTNYEINEVNTKDTTINIFQPIEDKDYKATTEDYSIGIEGNTLFGGLYNVGYNVNKEENSNSEENDFTSFIGVTFKQPILKGFTRNTPFTRMRIARRDRLIAFHKYRKTLMEIIAQVETAYWNLVLAQEQHKMAIESLDIAKSMVEDANERFIAGKMSQMDLYESEAGMAIREFYKSDAYQNVLDAMVRLKLLLTDGFTEKDLMIVAIDSLISDTIDSLSLNQDASIEFAMKSQPDYIIYTTEIEKEKILLDYLKDQSLPELNITGSCGFSGFGNTIEESIAQMTDQYYPTWTLKFDFSIPLFMGLRQQSELAAGKIKKEIREKQLKTVKTQLVNSIVLLFQYSNSVNIRIENIQNVVSVKKRILDVELSRMEAGMSNTRLVYEAEEELSDARKEELETMLNYREIMSQLALIRGSILSERKLENVVNNRFILSDNLTTQNNLE